MGEKKKKSLIVDILNLAGSMIQEGKSTGTHRVIHIHPRTGLSVDAKFTIGFLDDLVKEKKKDTAVEPLIDLILDEDKEHALVRVQLPGVVNERDVRVDVHDSAIEITAGKFYKRLNIFTQPVAVRAQRFTNSVLELEVIPADSETGV